MSQNGVDDGGVPPASIQNSPYDLEQWWQSEHGDLRLDHYFAEDEEEVTVDQDGDGATDETEPENSAPEL